MKRYVFLLVSLLITSVSVQAKEILTSIKPIQLITWEITKGVSQPDVLLGNNTSPHDYALKPSDVKRLKKADLVIWFGQDLEPFLTKVLEQQPTVLTLSSIKGLALREYEGGHHEHEGHHHGSHDPHFWLGKRTTLQVALAISEKLAQVDPDNAAKYQANFAEFEQNIKQVSLEIEQRLQPVEEKGYYVFHDAYGYFEQDYQLNHLGHFTVSPDRKPGAKTLIQIRKSLANNDTKCVFSEPQFTPAVIKSVTRGSNVNVGILDPVASDITIQDGAYFQFLTDLSKRFAECLAN
ncbi:zinc ABC transporter substrate-binding protein ZnuA [Vibrio sp. TRT 21S02]|uniref:zinc ABC transporter substrate-binding protein ZnuA n=1 Tax=Vibrio sp. TRT 21S02 TaxID=3418507 RepID=UPI003CE7885E